MILDSAPGAAFFRALERNTADFNLPALLDQYADTFMAATPQGAHCLRNADFAEVLPRRKQLFESLGSRSTSLVSCVPTRLDDRYLMAETRWQLTFARPNDLFEEILLDSLYIVDTSVGDGKIVFYLAHQDPIAILKARGILAP
jgi:hypothetical protein